MPFGETGWHAPCIHNLVWLTVLSLFAAAAGTFVPASQEILARVAATSACRHAVEYAGERRYAVQNLRFSKAATVRVRVTFRPEEGKTFTIVDRSGSEKLIAIVEKLLAAEAESSRPVCRRRHEIGPANYQARVRGTEIIDGRTCYVLDLTPKSKSRYLISGAVWVDKETYGIVRLDGTTSSNISFWIGSPHIVENFAQVEGIWLPQHTKAVSSTVLLGQSELEILYTDYRVNPRETRPATSPPLGYHGGLCSPPPPA